MGTVALTSDTFEQAVTGDGIVLVDFWAAWCGPCRRFAPTFEQASEQHPDIVFGKVDTEAEPALAGAAALAQVIAAVRELDMAEVWSKLAQAAAR
jgi:thioredoxin 1